MTEKKKNVESSLGKQSRADKSIGIQSPSNGCKGKQDTKEQCTLKQSQLAFREKNLIEAEKFTLFSDVFLSVALNDIPACQHVLCILMGIPDLAVRDVRTQYSISKVTSHGARLDVLAEDSRRTLYSIEIQRSDTVDHPRRTRFYGAMLDSEFLRKNKEYGQLPEVYILYISEQDIWKAGQTVYEVEKYLGHTGERYDDGLHIIYINAEVDDGTETAKLMKYFRTADPGDDSQGELSKRVNYLKRTEGGRDIMCDVTEKIMAIGREEGEKRGVRKSKREVARNLADMGMTVEFIAKAVNEKAGVVARWLERTAV